MKEAESGDKNRGGPLIEDPLFYTETMARLLTRQGKLDQAAEIYRYLLSQERDRPEIRAALAQVEACIGGRRNSRQQALSDLLARWIELTLRWQAVQRLDDCRKMAGARRAGAS